MQPSVHDESTSCDSDDDDADGHTNNDNSDNTDTDDDGDCQCTQTPRELQRTLHACTPIHNKLQLAASERANVVSDIQVRGILCINDGESSMHVWEATEHTHIIVFL